MLNRRALLATALVLILGFLAFGLFQLLNLRFARGDVYPRYSSLRGDPLGCRVYFDSLQQLPSLQVRRHIQSIEKWPDGPGTTMFIFGLPWNEMTADEREYRILETFLRDGGRLVVTLHPEIGRPRFFTPGTGTPARRNPLREDEDRRREINLLEKWGFGYAHRPLSSEERVHETAIVNRIAPERLPQSLKWHSALVFTNLDLNWRVLYARGTDAVMIERRLGNGLLVLATDSYFVSNEALRDERSPELLAWLAGPNREVVFSETHLGVQETPGIATLARRYRLHGGAAALIALAVLFIWRASVSFAPRVNLSQSAAPVLGRESAAGFENLLRRSVASKDLLQTALDEWHRTATLDARITPQRRERIVGVVGAFNRSEKPNPLETYREIARILNRRK